jgi:abortive infection bacteriophage resistance protein
MKKKIFDKQLFSFADHLQQMKGRNLIVADDAKAMHYLA